MYGLSSALSNALSGLTVTQSQTALVSRNITRASDPDYSKKILGLTTDLAGNARSANIVRVAERRLTEAVSTAVSDTEKQRVLSEALLRLSETVGDVEADGSIAWGIGQLQSALVEYEASPNNISVARNAISMAANLAESLNSATDTVSNLRQDAENGISSSVTNVNTILAEIEDLNSRLTGSGSNVDSQAEILDKRDAAVKRLSAEMGVRTVERPNNGISIYTDSGVTLFDITARSVTFSSTSLLSPGGTGNAVFVDGVQVTGAGAPMPLKSGKIVANVQVRDNLTVTYQTQLDEVARTIVTQFAETDQGVPPVLPAATGLFSYSGSPSVPTAATRYAGLAGEIKINPLFDDTQGGNIGLLRDGGSNGASYVYNSSGSSGFQDRLRGLVDALDAPVAFDSSAGLQSNGSIQLFAASSAGWVEQARSNSSLSLNKVEATLQRSTDAWSKKSGVNIDEEMATLLNLEKSYQAAAKIVSTIDQMLATLMQVVR